jgi:hypothetical protein
MTTRHVKLTRRALLREKNFRKGTSIISSVVPPAHYRRDVSIFSEQTSPD